MIKNAREYRITKAWLARLEQTWVEYPENPPAGQNVDPAIWSAGRGAYRGQIEELRGQIEEYEALRCGKVPVFELASIEELPRALIMARIAQGLTQKQLAGRLGIKEPQVQKYEATAYASASFSRLMEVVRVLGLRVSVNVLLPPCSWEHPAACDGA